MRNEPIRLLLLMWIMIMMAMNWKVLSRVFESAVARLRLRERARSLLLGVPLVLASRLPLALCLSHSHRTNVSYLQTTQHLILGRVSLVQCRSISLLQLCV